jgi:hypothetical protein
MAASGMPLESVRASGIGTTYLPETIHEYAPHRLTLPTNSAERRYTKPFVPFSWGREPPIAVVPPALSSTTRNHDP